jgi:hypothetical protein
MNEKLQATVPAQLPFQEIVSYSTENADIENPADGTYRAFQDAFAVFNDELFGGELPDCLITLQRTRRSKPFRSDLERTRR